MANKEYLKTTFPDGTPVKIYPGAREMLKMSNEELAIKLPSTKAEIKQAMDEYLDMVTERIDVAKEELRDNKIVAYDHREGYPRPNTWKEYKTMFAELKYNG